MQPTLHAPGNMTRYAFAGSLLACLVWANCAGTPQLDTSSAGRTVVFDAAAPNFDLEAVATLRAGETGLDVYLGLPHRSLVFVRVGEQYVASYEAIVRVRSDKEGYVVLEQAAVDSLTVANYAETQRFTPSVTSQRLTLKAGVYVVEVVLTDLANGAKATRRQRVHVPAARAGRVTLSRIRLESVEPGRPLAPIVSFHVPAQLDSLRAVVEVYPPQGIRDVEVSLHLARLQSDTTVAPPPYWLAPTHGSLHYLGIFYDEADTIQVNRRRLEAVEEAVLVTFFLPPLPEGIYRLEVQARPRGQEAAASQRDLSVRAPAFPQVATLSQMIAALTYIAEDDELQYIRAADARLERKNRFDAFWGNLVPNRQHAANLVKLYYSRVEEANLLFTTFKEGWKTDRGMIYIVFGPPFYVEERFDTVVWRYSYDEGDQRNAFTFEKVHVPGTDEAFDNHVLARKPDYYALWHRAVERWRSGTVL